MSLCSCCIRYATRDVAVQWVHVYSWSHIGLVGIQHVFYDVHSDALYDTVLSRMSLALGSLQGVSAVLKYVTVTATVL